jgi:hypothetical protein
LGDEEPAEKASRSRRRQFIEVPLSVISVPLIPTPRIRNLSSRKYHACELRPTKNHFRV